MDQQLNELEIIQLLKKLDQDDAELEYGMTADSIMAISDGIARAEQAVAVAEPHFDDTEPVPEAETGSRPPFEITVSEDHLEAFLTVHRTDGQDGIPKLKEIIEAAEKLNIKVRLDIAAILREIRKPAHRPVVIARGMAPVQGRDATIELYFPEKIEYAFHEVGGTIDFRSHLHIPSVRSGELMAKKHPPVPGQKGYDVFGNTLCPGPVRDIQMVGRDSVEITPDFAVVARKDGRPRVTGNRIKYFDINKVFVVPGNVDLKTGNIVFSGDVVVHGDVTDNMIIEALGNIYMSGSIFNSTLTATGSIAVKGNVIGSRLYSGYFGMLFNRLYNGTRQLIEILEKVMKSAKLLEEELARRNRQARFGQILVLIAENKYRHALDVVKELLNVITTIQSFSHREDYQDLARYLNVCLQPVKIIENVTAQNMEHFMNVLRKANMRVALSQETNARIVINHAQSSVLKSNGDILVRKEGVIHCDLYSARNIVFHAEHSVCRGCKLEAGDTISAMLVGGVTGVRSMLKAMRKVIVKKMFEGRITVGRRSVDIFEPVEEAVFDHGTIGRYA